MREYATYLDSFEDVCCGQCDYYFQTFHGGKFRRGVDYDWKFLGDELAVFVHSGRPANNVYQLVGLAITLKCGWLGMPPNMERVRCGFPSAELAAGVHTGTVWATPRDGRWFLRGSTINIAKRVESASRTGEHFRIFVSDPAFKRIGRKVRNLLFSPRQVVGMKGVVLPVAVREVRDSFMDLSARLCPRFVPAFRHTAPLALDSATFDLWIHSCLQVWEEAANGRVTDECLDLCRRVLHLEPSNACALYHAAQGVRERGDLETAKLYLEDLTRCTPDFADGWLELGRVLKQLGSPAAARQAVLHARRHGVATDEESLPDLAP